ncbi:hypothetical protein [Pseudoruegeria sp. SK021]|uniref:hypothetical protein n=1 Tax=Pseudoruegeria sp. SK021 TaxID=1933035 RepID=UPI000A32330C|nr:hypothetical protein [Pseudoruegeria sp. SK021]
MPLTIFDLIEFRAFSSFWYWVVVGLIWVRTITVPLGIPVDLIRRAEAGHAQAQDDLETSVAMILRRRTGAGAVGGAWQVGGWAFVLTALIILAIGYGIEVAQALLLLALPLALVAATTAATARRILAAGASGSDLRQRLFGLKLRVQAIGLTAVFLSAVWGMYYTLATYSF